MTNEPTDIKKGETLEKTLENLPQNVRSLIPDANMGYYKSTNEMHCDTSKPGGSKFLEVGNIFEVLDMKPEIGNMVSERKDDREKLLASGADASAFLPATKGPGEPEGLPEALYYKVEGVKGKLGVIQLSELSPGTSVIIRREKSVIDEQGKEKVPCSFSIIKETMDDMPDCDFATVIVGREGGEQGKNELWTVHPGAPIRAAQGDFIPGSEKLPGPKEGETQEAMVVTVRELLKSGKMTEADYVKIIIGKKEEVLAQYKIDGGVVHPADSKSFEQAFEDKFKLKITQELKDPEDLREVAAWFENEIEEFLDENSSMYGHNFEWLVKNLAEYVIQKAGIENDNITVKARDDERFAGLEGNHGIVNFMGVDIFNYESADDGWGVQITKVNLPRLKIAICDLLKVAEKWKKDGIKSPKK